MRAVTLYQPWAPANIVVAGMSCPFTRAGYVYRGLGMWVSRPASPKGRRPTCWSLTHLGSGLRVAAISGALTAALAIAAEIAEAGDWEFESPDGWRNADPELPHRVHAIVDRHSGCSLPACDEATAELSRAAALRVAQQRAWAT